MIIIILPWVGGHLYAAGPLAKEGIGKKIAAKAAGTQGAH